MASVLSMLLCLGPFLIKSVLSNYQRPVMDWVGQNMKLVVFSFFAVVLSIGASNPVDLQIALEQRGYSGAVGDVFVNICEAAQRLVVFLIKS
eukprot:CAMPEP_0175162184 /NCGR_PEP_ID=MMETSP0087-20121206/25019_1 /TAXON_ID=136419 /ORGANISM="Unknown Unknown, Strain D1" /LENGTH=91 /DNA_ID=CAMNT_0016450681 /DNA_START=16 /DNA_END=288 /DNA_ORIENTATION=+